MPAPHLPLLSSPEHARELHTIAVLHRTVALIDKYVDGRDSRTLLKAMRYSNFLRRHLPISELRVVMAVFVLDKERLARLSETADAVLLRRPEPVRGLPATRMLSADAKMRLHTATHTLPAPTCLLSLYMFSLSFTSIPPLRAYSPRAVRSRRR